PMRRASEMPWVDSMIQIGLRGAGSGRRAEVDAAREFGSILVKADELHKTGVEKVLRKVPPAAHYYVTVDIDGLDPSIAPATGAPEFGGLSYYEATDLLKGIASKGNLVGFDMVEVAPSLGGGNSTSLLAAQLILNMIGALVQERQIKSDG
ncbi:MAG: arginase family protein, partial [bacterium]